MKEVEEDQSKESIASLFFFFFFFSFWFVNDALSLRMVEGALKRALTSPREEKRVRKRRTHLSAWRECPSRLSRKKGREKRERERKMKATSFETFFFPLGLSTLSPFPLHSHFLLSPFSRFKPKELSTPLSFFVPFPFFTSWGTSSLVRSRVLTSMRVRAQGKKKRRRKKRVDVEIAIGGRRRFFFFRAAVDLASLRPSASHFADFFPLLLATAARPHRPDLSQ